MGAWVVPRGRFMNWNVLLPRNFSWQDNNFDPDFEYIRQQTHVGYLAVNDIKLKSFPDSLDTYFSYLILDIFMFLDNN